jgi:uncharacterized protein (DUF983 family)
MNESETRAEHIDTALKTAGLIVVPTQAITRICPQMSQMFTDERKSMNICDICGSDFRHRAAADGRP